MSPWAAPRNGSPSWPNSIAPNANIAIHLFFAILCLTFPPWNLVIETPANQRRMMARGYNIRGICLRVSEVSSFESFCRASHLAIAPILPGRAYLTRVGRSCFDSAADDGQSSAGGTEHASESLHR